MATRFLIRDSFQLRIRKRKFIHIISDTSYLTSGTNSIVNEYFFSRPSQIPDTLAGKRSGVETGTRKFKKKEDMIYSPTTVMAGDAPKTNTSKKRKNKKGRKKFAWKFEGLSSCSKACGGGEIFLLIFSNGTLCNGL